MKDVKNWLLVIFSILVLVSGGLMLRRGNQSLTATEYSVTDAQIPPAFDGFRIAQISDLHNTVFGEDNQELLNLLTQTQPDIIAITGDLVDFKRTDMDAAFSFVREAMKIAQCYYVAGNHEPNIGIEEYRVFESQLRKLGVRVLNDDRYSLIRDAQTLTLAGIGDPVYSDLYGGIANNMFPWDIWELTEPGDYTVLLCHRPEFLEAYAMAEVELVLTGHAHGGQIRFPFTQGLWAPNQGFFPQYTSGMYVENATTMIVSRGLGNSTFPFRINNRPEIVVVELHTD